MFDQGKGLDWAVAVLDGADARLGCGSREILVLPRAAAALGKMKERAAAQQKANQIVRVFFFSTDMWASSKILSALVRSILRAREHLRGKRVGIFAD